MKNKLELILNKGTPCEFLVNLGELKTKIDVYGLDSVPVETYKNYIQAKYDIKRKDIKANWINYQNYLIKNGLGE